MHIDSLLAVLDAQQVEYRFINRDANSSNIQKVASLDKASADSLTFLNSSKYLKSLQDSLAGVVILKPEFADQCLRPAILVSDPYYVYSLLAQILYAQTPPYYGISKTAIVCSSVPIEEQVCIEDNVVIKSDASIGDGSWIQPGTVIYQNVKLGKNCLIGANVVIHQDCIIGDNVRIESGTVIGGDGFGWAPHQGGWSKIPQVGRVIIGDNVSIGNNACIDRGAINDTLIGDNCIIDNMVHVAHNVIIGEGTAVAAQTGFAGTTTLGKYNIIGGQCGFVGHLSTVDHCHFSAKTGVTHDMKKPGNYAGFPALEVPKWQKQVVRQRNLEKLVKQLNELQQQVIELQQNI